MAMTTVTGSPILAPEDVDALLILPTLEASVAAQVARVVRIRSTSFRIPRVAEDPTASWTAEGQEIAPSDATLDEVTVVPAKVAGLTVISNELAADSSPEAAQVVGDGLSRDIARQVDAAFFGSLAAPAPAGLGSLAGVTAVDAGASWTDLDSFAEAAAAAEVVGADLTAFIAHPSDALLLATIKDASGSNRALLATDPTQPARRTVEGRPLFVSASVTPGTVWGLDSSRTMLVVREDASVTADGSPFFTSDRTAVRATMRFGIAFAHAASVVKVSLTATP